MEQNEKLEAIKQLNEKTLEEINQAEVENLLQNNVIEFKVGEDLYRITKPTFAQNQETAKFKIKKFNELLRDPDLYFQADLKERLKSKNIDIDKMQEKFLNLEIEKKSYQFKLGKMLAEKASETDLNELREQIKDLEEKQNEISAEKNSYLEFSLENQLVIYLYAFITALITEKKIGENWERVWKSYEDLERCESPELVRKAGFYSTFICSDLSSSF